MSGAALDGAGEIERARAPGGERNHHGLTDEDRLLDPERPNGEPMGPADARHLEGHGFTLLRSDDVWRELPEFYGHGNDSSLRGRLRLAGDRNGTLLWRHSRRASGKREDRCNREKEGTFHEGEEEMLRI